MKPFGNYCGPWWSAGKIQRSVVSDVPPVDELDKLCMAHDAAYAQHEDLRKADETFAESAKELGGWGTVFGGLVGMQSMLRTHDNQKKMKSNNKQRLRGSGSSSGPLSMGKAQQQRNDTVSAAPVAFATKRTGAAARMTTKPDGTVEVSHRTFLNPVVNETGFVVQAVPCNPGLSGSFPWLSKIARRYEEYRFKKLRYEFRSVASSSTSGVIMMSFDYDAADDAPASKGEQAQTIPNSECNVWMNNDLAVPMDGKYRYVRAGTLPPNLDVKTYDMGNMWISSAYGNNVTGGELYVEYTVELRKPTAGVELGGTLTSSTTSFAAPFVATSTTSGPAYPFKRISDTSLEVTAGGEYLLVAKAVGTGLTAGVAAPTIVSGGPNSTITELGFAVASGTTLRLWRIRVDTGDELVFANAGAGSTLSSLKIYATSADYASLIF